MDKDSVVREHEAVCMLLGEAAYLLVAEGRAVTNISLKEMIAEISVGEPNKAEDFALQVLLN